ncbi:formylglycine-generating enzyme family protein [Oceanospirillum sp. D5]|uniref:Formylglycine-generating enzyme family protein n=2 Tax=Oceanospirillum sediminis TaxID=2760088 RepID=A0A839IRI0_9GAMM|nr:formylglycine-generating enzyme family protein [Oceanospirillum sediminis]
MGLYHRSQTVLQQWIKLGRQFRSAGFKPTVLAPVPEKWLPKELTALYQCLSWDRGSTLNPAPGRFNLDQVSEFRSKARESLACYLPAIKPDIEAQQKAALLVKHCTVCDTSCPEDTARKAFLTWLSAAVEVDDVDLRAVRLAVGKPLSVADEVLFWQSELVNKGSNLCVYLSPVHEKLRDQLQQQINLYPNKAVQIFNALSSTLKTQLAIDYYEALLFFRHCSELSAQHQLLLTEAEQYTHRFILALAKEKSPTPHEEYEGIHEYSQSILDRLGQKEKQGNRRYSYWWSQWYKNLSAEDKEQAIPDWIDKSVFQAVNSTANSAEYTIKLAIKDNYLELTEVGESTLPDSHQLDGLDQPLSNADIKTNYDQVVYQRSEQGKLIESENLVLKKGLTTSFQLDRFSEQSLQLNIGDQNLRLASFKRPNWAASLQYKNNQVSADLILNNTRIQVPLSGSDVVDNKDIPQWGISLTELGSLIQSIAEDEYGLYADLNFFGITQRFRWIEPGTFLMGSPNGESERYNDEAQHQVTLTQGYWLADTCVTQQLWQAVMGENPSNFKGEQNPVEKISWLDCWQFIQKLKEQYPALRLTLPSEAQWEYACRAGTATPFSFGSQIHSDQANFNGNYPYNDGKKSEYRQTTIPIKSLPANPWGLYEMHGNVLEWCQDNDLRAYKADEAVIDPGQECLEKPDSKSFADHPVRGGGLQDDGLYCRSASRVWYEAGARRYDLGFRLALGPELQQGGVDAKGRKVRFQSSEQGGAASKPETSRSGPDFLTDHDDFFRLSESKLSETDTLSGSAELKEKFGKGWAKFFRRNKDK